MSAHLFGLLAVLVPAAMQFGLFAFLARMLGATEYGLYIALMSWSPICFELIGWGAGEYMVQRTAQDRSNFPSARGHVRAAFWMSLPLAVLAFVMLALASSGDMVSIWTIAAIGFAEFAGLRLFVNAEQSAIALGRMAPANWLRGLQIVPRIGGIAFAYFLLEQRHFEGLALAGSLGMLCAGLGAAWIMNASLPRTGGLKFSTAGAQQGSWFMGIQLLRAGQHNIDRVVLAPLIDPAALGLYSAAQRFIQIGLLPLQAVLRITYPGFFKAGTGGIGAATRYGWSILPLALGASAVTTLGLVAAAGLLPLLVGPEFEQSVIYLLYLAPILPLFAINSVLSDTLSGAGHVPIRLVLAASGIAVQATMFWFWHDDLQIVLASYAGIGCTSVLSAGAVVLLARRGRNSVEPAAGLA